MTKLRDFKWHSLTNTKIPKTNFLIFLVQYKMIGIEVRKHLANGGTVLLTLDLEDCNCVSVFPSMKIMILSSETNRMVWFLTYIFFFSFLVILFKQYIMFVIQKV